MKPPGVFYDKWSFVGERVRCRQAGNTPSASQSTQKHYNTRYITTLLHPRYKCRTTRTTSTPGLGLSPQPGTKFTFKQYFNCISHIVNNILFIFLSRGYGTMSKTSLTESIVSHILTYEALPMTHKSYVLKYYSTKLYNDKTECSSI